MIAYLLCATTPDGSQRRTIHLSPQRHHDKRRDWEARGWVVDVHRVPLTCLDCDLGKTSRAEEPQR